MFVKYTTKNKLNYTMILLVMFFLFILIIAITEIIGKMKHPLIGMYLLILYISIAVYYVLRYMIPSYTYSIINSDFTISRRISKREKTLVNIKLSDIKLICKPDNPKLREVCEISFCPNMTTNFFNNNFYILVYVKNGKTKKMKIVYDSSFFKVLNALVKDRLLDFKL